MTANPRVLVVDDDATTRDLLLMVLEDEGYAADGAPDGQAQVPPLTEVPPQRWGGNSTSGTMRHASGHG